MNSRRRALTSSSRQRGRDGYGRVLTSKTPSRFLSHYPGIVVVVKQISDWQDERPDQRDKHCWEGGHGEWIKVTGCPNQNRISTNFYGNLNSYVSNMFHIFCWPFFHRSNWGNLVIVDLLLEVDGRTDGHWLHAAFQLHLGLQLQGPKMYKALRIGGGWVTVCLLYERTVVIL